MESDDSSVSLKGFKDSGCPSALKKEQLVQKIISDLAQQGIIPKPTQVTLDAASKKKSIYDGDKMIRLENSKQSLGGWYVNWMHVGSLQWQFSSSMLPMVMLSNIFDLEPPQGQIVLVISA